MSKLSSLDATLASYRHDRPVSPPRPAQQRRAGHVDRASETVDAMKQDLRAILDTTLRRVADKARHQHEYGGIAAELQHKTERMQELDTQDALNSFYTAFEGKLAKLLGVVSQLESSISDVKRDAERAATENRASINRTDARQHDLHGQMARVQAQLETLERRAKETEGRMEESESEHRHLAEQTESSSLRLEDTLRRLEERVSNMATRQDELEGTMRGMASKVEMLEKVVASHKYDDLDLRVRSLERYNEEFLDLSKRSTQSFEAEVDGKLSALDTRYASLLKHYHSTLMNHITKVQESCEHRARSWNETLDSEVAKLSEELAHATSQWQVTSEKVHNEVRTLYRRLTSGLRVMKDANEGSSALRSFATPAATRTPGATRDLSFAEFRTTHLGVGATSPTPSPQKSSGPSRPSPHAETDAFLRDLERLSGGLS